MKQYIPVILLSFVINFLALGLFIALAIIVPIMFVRDTGISPNGNPTFDYWYKWYIGIIITLYLISGLILMIRVKHSFGQRINYFGSFFLVFGPMGFYFFLIHKDNILRLIFR